MQILSGKEVAIAVKVEVQARAVAFEKKFGRRPGLGVLLIGQDPASHVYVRNKEKTCESAGFKSFRVDLPSSASESEVLKIIETEFNAHPLVDGFLVQMPIPKQISSEKVLDVIDPQKDSDGLTPTNLGLLWAGRPRVIPCTPYGVMKIFKHYGIELRGTKSVVVGRSQIVGRPMAHLMTMADSTVAVCHSRTLNLSSYTKEADIVIVAAGQKHLLGKDDFKKGSIVIDVGIHGSGSGSGVTGDVRFGELADVCAAATPVPGGVGPMTIACLLENTMTLAEKRMDGVR